MDSLWLTCYSVECWESSDIWNAVFANIESLLGARLTHIDDKDPIRRRAKAGGPGEFITMFKDNESTRWILGKYGNVGVDFSIRYFKKVTDTPNKIQFFFNKKTLNHFGYEVISDLIKLLSQSQLNIFYAYSDNVDVIASKNKEFGSVDIFSELIGVFWMTVFSKRYLDFFSKSAEELLPFGKCELLDKSSILLSLANCPCDVDVSKRLGVEEFLGSDSFVDPTSHKSKVPGRYALSLDGLTDECI